MMIKAYANGLLGVCIIRDILRTMKLVWCIYCGLEGQTHVFFFVTIRERVLVIISIFVSEGIIWINNRGSDALTCYIISSCSRSSVVLCIVAKINRICVNYRWRGCCSSVNSTKGKTILELWDVCYQ